MTKAQINARIDELIVPNGNLKAIDFNPLLKEIVNMGDDYVELEITGDQIVNNLSPEIAEILPVLEGERYYDIHKVAFEVTGGSEPFELDPEVTTGFIIKLNGSSIGLNPADMVLLSEGQKNVSIPKFSDSFRDTGTNFFSASGQRPLGSGIHFRTYGNTPVLIAGNGTLLIKVWYSIQTFGSQL